MIPLKFNRSLALLALIGLILYFGTIFISPLLSGDLEEDLSRPSVTKEEAGQLAEELVNHQEPDYIITDTTVLHQTDKVLSAYLQQQKIATDYSRQYGDQYPVDFWEVRISGTASEPMWVVRISMTVPEVTSWTKLSSSAIASSSTEVRRAAADTYLIEQGYDPQQFQLVPGTPSNLFVYESLDTQVGDAVLELTVKVTEESISGFMPTFSVPDNFKLWLAKEEALAGKMSMVALGGTFIINLAAIILVIINRREVLFVRGIVFAIIFALIYFIHTLNSLPGVSTQVSPQEAAFMNLFYIFFTFGLVSLLAVAQYFTAISGEQLWRKEGWNSWPRWREAHFGREVFYAMGRGYLICLFILGVQQFLFLIAGFSFDSFAINDPTQSVHNLFIPALFPLLAWMAAISEEVVYRLFAISVFKKLFRWPVVAVIISSVIWALGHTGYTIYPSYTRLFEVAVLGVIFGYMFLKYGLFTVIFAHATMNSILMALSLMFSLGTPVDIAWGLFYIILPAIIGYVVMWLHTAANRNKRSDGMPNSPISYWDRQPVPAASGRIDGYSPKSSPLSETYRQDERDEGEGPSQDDNWNPRR